MTEAPPTSEEIVSYMESSLRDMFCYGNGIGYSFYDILIFLAVNVWRNANCTFWVQLASN